MVFSLRLERDVHAAYLARGLNYLSRWMVALDASKPWLTYWILHSLDLLEVEISQDVIERYDFAILLEFDSQPRTLNILCC
jgi:protein farnesyltransferase subunit beta